MEFLTVFTPTYNRAHTLIRTYKSLCAQECKEFIWLVVDDGSTDNTSSLVREWQAADEGFRIEYIYKDNGGMHTAHNTAYENIHTELNMCIDSDDIAAPGAIESIKEAWNSISDKGFAGLIALDADFDGNVIGKGFPEGLTSTTLNGYYASGGAGDKKLIYRTAVINSVPPYPVFFGEKYVALAYKYRMIDQQYNLAVLDKVICYVEYQSSGSSATMWKQYIKNPQGFAFWRKVCMEYPQSKKRLFIDAIHYVAESIIAKDVHFIRKSPRKILTALSLPAGVILYWVILYKARKQRLT